MNERDTRLALEVSGFGIKNRADLMSVMNENKAFPVDQDESGQWLYDADDVEKIAQSGEWHPNGTGKSMFSHDEGEKQRGQLDMPLPRVYDESVGYELPPRDPTDYDFSDYWYSQDLEDW